MSPVRSAGLAESINATLADLLEQDPRLLLLGEDIGRLGGVFRVTRGLQERFGKDRVRDALLAEATIVGQAIGMAISGLVPVCEIQFDGFTYPAANQLVTQAARIGGRWNGQVSPSLVVRIPTGGGFRGVEHHSESNEALFARVPDLGGVSLHRGGRRPDPAVRGDARFARGDVRADPSVLAAEHAGSGPRAPGACPAGRGSRPGSWATSRGRCRTPQTPV